jgi:virginiamycin A acetyltransferase
MNCGWLYPLYRFPSRLTRKIILWLVQKLERGEFYSTTLRRIYRDYRGVEVGMYSYGCFSPCDIPAGTVVGRYCSFAKGVVIFNANHPLERKSLHPFFYNPRLNIVPKETIQRSRLRIGHDVWIGRNAMIMPRLTEIGNGAVIGAGSVVTKDVPAYAIVAGNPARILRYRFSEEVRKQIEESRWWEESIEALRDCLDEFLSPMSEVNLTIPINEHRK